MIAAGGTYLLDVVQAERRFHILMWEAQERGFATSLATLQPPLPPELNAAPLLLAVTEKMGARGKDEAPLQALYMAPEDLTQEDIRTLKVSSLRGMRYLSEIKTGLERPCFRLPIAPGQWIFDSPYMASAPIRNALKAILYVALDNGDIQEATEACHMLLLLAGHCCDATLFAAAYAEHFGTIHQSFKVMSYLVRHAPLQQEELFHLLQTAARIRPIKGAYATYVAGEVATAFDTYWRLRHNLARPGNLRLLAHALELSLTSADLISRLYIDVVGHAEAIDRTFRGLASAGPFPSIFLNMHVPVSAAIRLKEEQDIAVLDLAVRAYRVQHNALPMSLADLVPALLPDVPIDPYNGLPYGYWMKTDGSGYDLKSVGLEVLGQRG